MDTTNSMRDKLLLQSRIEQYADQGYGSAFLKDDRLADMVQETLLRDDGKRYRLSSWVIMPNHVHLLATRFEDDELADIMQAFKSITSHKANKALRRKGQFWMPEYFDRYIRNAKHYQKTVEYFENNPVKARLCAKPDDYRFSSAWFRKHARVDESKVKLLLGPRAPSPAVSAKREQLARNAQSIKLKVDSSETLRAGRPRSQ